jgi:hypothetical protein
MATSPRILELDKKSVSKAPSPLVLTRPLQAEYQSVVETAAVQSDANQTEKRYLSSWKEIAQYIGVSLRTVQRWERHCGLPVRRPGGKRSGMVIAIATEIDDWVLRIPASVRALPAREIAAKFSE